MQPTGGGNALVAILASSQRHEREDNGGHVEPYGYGQEEAEWRSAKLRQLFSRATAYLAGKCDNGAACLATALEKLPERFTKNSRHAFFDCIGVFEEQQRSDGACGVVVGVL